MRYSKGSFWHGYKRSWVNSNTTLNSVRNVLISLKNALLVQRDDFSIGKYWTLNSALTVRDWLIKFVRMTLV